MTTKTKKEIEMRTIEDAAAALKIKGVISTDGTSVVNVTDAKENIGEYFILLQDGSKRVVTIDSDGIKIEYELADIKNRFEGEDICFGAHTPMGEIEEIINFDNETMDASVMVKYSDGEKRPAKINIDSDLCGFDVRF